MPDTDDDRRDWEHARRLAAQLPPFTPAELRQLALLGRQLDGRSEDTAS